tara:strand:+ start:153 stop:662 length:510 start_codon:yes stop_codon:yes gene_type:complete
VVLRKDIFMKNRIQILARKIAKIERQSSSRQHHKEMMDKYRLRSLDTNRYTKIKGLEGPFQYKNNHVLYYDSIEGRYYNSDSDMYLTYDEADRIVNARLKQSGSIKGRLLSVIDKYRSDLDRAVKGDFEDHDFSNYLYSGDMTMALRKSPSTQVKAILLEMDEELKKKR